MEEQMIELAKEVGRLQEQIKQKDSIISTLLSQLSNSHSTVEVTTPVTTSTAEPSTSETTVEEPVKKRSGRPKGSKNTVKASSPVVTASTITPGGTVFKQFETLELNKVAVEGANTSAYIPSASKSVSCNNRATAISVGLGSMSTL